MTFMVVLHKKGTDPSVHYELTNHLGNVLAVITPDASDATQPAIESLTDYYPFGMEEPGRSYSTDEYRYGFNGKENDKDGNFIDFGARLNKSHGRQEQSYKISTYVDDEKSHQKVYDLIGKYMEKVVPNLDPKGGEK